MTIRAQTGPPYFRDEAYPDGYGWRCECGDFSCADDEDFKFCPKCGEQLSRVARRISWGPLPAQKRDVVVEFR